MRFMERYVNTITHALCDVKGCPFAFGFMDCSECPFRKTGSPHECALEDSNSFEYIKTLLLSDVPDPEELTDNELIELQNAWVNLGMTYLRYDAEGFWYAYDVEGREILINTYQSLNPNKTYYLRSLIEKAKIAKGIL